jgi:DNA-binding LytR/AlgR family response regulator
MFRKAMKQWAQELAETSFVRVHRQAIINLNFFSHLDKSADGQPQIHLRDFAQPVPVSQRCAPELNRRLKNFRPT